MLQSEIRRNLNHIPILSPPTAANAEEALRNFPSGHLDPEQKAQLKTLLEQNQGLWRAVGDAGTWSRSSALTNIPKDTVISECLDHGLKSMRKELLIEGDSTLEVVLVEQIITCWLNSSYVSHQLEVAEKAENYANIVRFERRYNQEQNRMIRLINQLSRIRKELWEVRDNDDDFWSTP